MDLYTLITCGSTERWSTWARIVTKLRGIGCKLVNVTHVYIFSLSETEVSLASICNAFYSQNGGGFVLLSWEY